MPRAFRRPEKEIQLQRKLLTRILALALVATFLLCAGCGAKPTPTPPETNPPQTQPSEEGTLPAPENEDVKIETPYCTLSIPYTFSELVVVERGESENTDSYVFKAVLEDNSVPVYTIHFVSGDSSATGDLFGTLKTDEGTVRILFEAFNPDEALEGDDLEAFYAAQETINDVFASLQATSNFKAA